MNNDHESVRAVQRVSRAGGEGGFVLIAVLFLVALILIALAVAAPKVAMSIRRDKELELVHRGEQYKRAIKLYYAKFGAYPSSIDQLMNTNQIRFLRKRYTDPFTGKDDWKVIYFGQAHVQPLGLFGQPIAGASQIGGATMPGQSIGAAATGAGSSSGSSSTGSSFGSSTGSTDGSSSGFGSSSGSGFGSSSGSGLGSSSGDSSVGSSSGSTSGTGLGSTTGAGTTTGTGTGTTPGTGSAFGSTGSTGSTLGGGPIVGVAIPDTHASIKEYKKQKHYNEWEFVYNPIEDQMQAMGALNGGQQNLNGSSTSGIGNNTGSGFGSSSGSGFGSSSGSGFGSSGGSGFGSSGGTGTGSGSGTGTTGNPPQQ
jgi:type II secretory pathway pseudopilin PulG